MRINIQPYLNSLPCDVVSIDLSSKNLYSLPDLSRFTNLQILNCSNNNICHLPPFNKNLKFVDCSFNRLKSLPEFNEKLIDINCVHNLLKSLPEFNENLGRINCSFNCLESIPPINEKLLILCCCNNKITRLHSLKNIQLLVCDNNNIICLPLLDNLLILHCQNNNINCLPLVCDELKVISSDSSIKTIDYCDNPIYKIVQNCLCERRNIITEFDVLNQIYKFKQLYYSLKFKKCFNNWLIKSKKVKNNTIMTSRV